MPKIAIIGANSYIARNLTALLKKEHPHYELMLYDNAECHADGEANYKCINIIDKHSVSQIDLNCDIIFMFVGKTGTANGFEDYDTFIDVNEKALLNLLNEYRNQSSEAKIIFPSTRLIYKGRPEKLTEDSEKEFKTIYAMNKYSCEQYLKQYHEVYNVKYCIFRICVPYGSLILGASSYGTAEFMLSCAQSGKKITLYGDGSLRRTITYIGDICRILICGAENENCNNDVYNIGGEDYSLREMAELISSKYNSGIDYISWPETARKIESGDTVFDDSKLRSVLKNTEYRSFDDWITGNINK